MIAFVGALCVVMALLTVFAIELSNTQAKSKRDVTSRVHERAVLAAALIDSLFQTVQQQVPQDAKLYGTRTVSASTMDRNAKQGSSAYLALLDATSGTVLAASRGFTPAVRSGLSSSTALALVHHGRPYGLGNVQPSGTTGTLDFAVQFPTQFGPRILVTGFRPSALSTFIGGELSKVPGVRGASNFLLDGNDTVLASTTPTAPVGSAFRSPALVRVLRRSSGEANGTYYDQVPLANSTWRVVLAAPTGPLFSSVSGLRKWVPWAIFLAFALVAVAALALARRALRSSEQLQVANARLELVNDELGQSNSALERRAAELARSNAELEQFASIASHDLQEPLRKVRTFTEQLTATESENLSDKGRDYLTRANAAAERMQKLIEDLLKFSRVATHGRPFEPVDLEQVAHQVLDDLDAQVERSGAVVAIGDLPTISADALQMRQLMQNLISNALKFRREGVVPEIAIDASPASAGGEVRLTVRDNGIGFEPQYSRRIFRVFERLHGRTEYPGTGIGLALCRKIVERHGGTIIADGVPGAGATFTVTLPVHQPEEVIAIETDMGDGAGAEQEEAHVGV